MQHLHPIAEDEMVAVFLQTESASSRFRPTLLEVLRRDGRDPRLVEHPDLATAADEMAYGHHLLLTGFSMEGLAIRLYASTYPHDGAGIVLVDAVHPDQYARFRAALPPPRANESAVLTAYRNHLIDTSSNNSEHLDVARRSAQVRRTGSFDRLPLAVVTRGLPEHPSPPVLPPVWGNGLSR